MEITTREAGTYQDEMMQLRLSKWKQLPKDETGAPILDKPLLSPSRLFDALVVRTWLVARGCRRLGFWYMMRWHGRPYKQFKHPKAGKRYD